MFIIILYHIYKIIEENIRIARVQRAIKGRKALWANMVPISLSKNMLKPYAQGGKAWGYFDVQAATGLIFTKAPARRSLMCATINLI